MGIITSLPYMIGKISGSLIIIKISIVRQIIGQDANILFDRLATDRNLS